jgi:DNA integrity scanning protein DisA with diadenylate cyclase activity
MQMADSYEEMQETIKNHGVSSEYFKDYSPEKLHKLIKPLLTKFQARVYDMMYVQNLDDIKVAELLGYKTSEKSRKIGYKSIQKLKKIFITKAKEVLNNNDF